MFYDPSMVLLKMIGIQEASLTKTLGIVDWVWRWEGLLNQGL